MKKLLTLSIFCCLFISSYAQSELPKKYPNVASIKVKEDFPKEGRTGNSGKGFSAALGNLPNGIKTVALVSFYIFDPGLTKTWTTSSSHGGYTYSTTYKKKTSTGALSGYIAEGAFAKSIDPMIAEFKTLGIDLLLPDQFLDNEEKKSFYNSFQVRHEKSFANWVGSFGEGNHDVMYGTLNGFNVADIVKEPLLNYEKNGLLARRKTNIADAQIYVFDKDTDMTESLGFELCSKLGVDAVLVTYMTVFMPSNNKIELVNSRFVMFGPNPTMPAVSKGGMIPHVKGLFYYGGSVSPETLIYNFDKKDPETEKLNFDGFDLIYTAQVRAFGSYYQKQMGKK